ncbi:MAG: hypothetical protein EA396_11080 [Anaerolineaceae bacterium]|nr:MAG: hypothetical protein EA396_11080 [Anaerolineaceae bacterium]
MKTLDVVFEVPAQIHQGMTSGSLERIGGVVRDSQTKQVVAWLRDGSAMSQTSNPIDQIFSVSAGQNLLSLAGRSALLLNLTLMTIRAVRINEQLNIISDEISSIKDEFKRDRLAKRRVAIRAARDVLTSQDIEVIRARFSAAQDGLYEAEQQLLRDIEKTTDASDQMAFLTQAMQMSALRVRCYLRLGQRDLALLDLKKDVQIFEAQTHHIIEQIIGRYPALFLHASLSDEAVNQFIDLQLWLKDQRLTVASYRDFLHEMRRDFWNTQALSMLDSRNPLERIQGWFPKRSKAQETGTSPLEQRLELAGIARENLERLQGFELEIREERLAGIARWETPVKSDDDDFQALIIDRQALENSGG